MSNIQDLIHKTSMDCIDKGQSMERERIIKLIYSGQWVGESLEQDVTNLVALIKGQGNE
jgi:NaMN:DMB phosphoribosyltransferase